MKGAANEPVPQPFDPVAFKKAQYESWSERARFWTSFAEEFDRWNRPVTAAMFEMAGLREGMRVIDVATGAGEPGLSAAAAVGPSGSVWLTDHAQAMIDHAMAEADRRGLRNVEGRVMDADSLDVDDASFDVLLCRFGIFFLPDAASALREWRRVLKPGGCTVITSYVSDETNWRNEPFEIIRARGKLAPPSENEPSAYLFASDGAERLFREAGYSTCNVRTIHAPCHFESIDACMDHMRREGSAFARLMSQIDQRKHEGIWDEVRESILRFQGPGGVEAVCDVVVAAGWK